MLNDATGGRPLWVVVSAPSGAGKSTLCDRWIREHPGACYSVSCTTRPPRGREVHGRDYFFLSDTEFDDYLGRGLFLEHAEVHGRRYGTLKATVESALAAGHSLVMDIDVQGARQIREQLRVLGDQHPMVRAFVDIFITVPSLEVVQQRLSGRGEDAPEQVALRLRNAQQEMAHAGEYRYVIENDDLETAYRAFNRVLQDEAGRE